MKSWLLVMALGSNSHQQIETVPNLLSPAECIRVAESIKVFSDKNSMKFKCVEVYNAKVQP